LISAQHNALLRPLTPKNISTQKTSLLLKSKHASRRRQGR
jgi:hypothetical protein